MNIKKRIISNFYKKDILLDMSFRQMRLKYAGAKLGLWWAVISPFILALSINFVFRYAFKINIDNFAFFVLSGIIPWIYITNTLSESTSVLINDASLVRQGSIPIEFLPFSTALANLLIFLIGMLFLLPFFIIIKYNIVFMLWFLPFVILMHFMFLTGLALFVSFINVFVRDFSHLLNSIFMVWFWVTPVFYSLEMIPSSYRWVCLLNPVTYYVIMYRDILFYGQLPDLNIILAGLFIAMVSLLSGYNTFIKNEFSILKRL